MSTLIPNDVEAKRIYNAAYYQRHRDGWNDNRGARDRKKYHESDRRYHLKRHYGVTVEEYNQLLVAQDGRCAICKTDSPGGRRNQYFHVDHDHKTGEIRGLLCKNCNIALGHLKDDVDLAMAVAAYLIQRENLLVLPKEVV